MLDHLARRKGFQHRLRSQAGLQLVLAGLQACCHVHLAAQQNQKARLPDQPALFHVIGKLVQRGTGRQRIN